MEQHWRASALATLRLARDVSSVSWEEHVKAVGIVGHQDSGKTTLIQALAPELRYRGHRIATVKHSSHGIDLEGKDTERLSESADQVAFISPMESIILWKGAKALEDILRYVDADIVLLEGFKTEKTFPKIACLKGEPEDRDLFDGLALCAVGPGNEVQGLHIPIVDGGDIGRIADLVEERAFKLPNLNCEACGHETCYGLALEIMAGSKTVEDCVSLQPTTQVMISGQLLPLKPFISDLVRGAVIGVLSSLKGFSPGEIEIHID
jgi:molybdopterin-guanine dinucleotide biosynthesis protein B